MNPDRLFQDNEIDRIADRIAIALDQRLNQPTTTAWLTAAQAGAHLGMTEDAIRGLVKRKQIPVHRTGSGRVRFERAELDEWVRSSCAE